MCRDKYPCWRAGGGGVEAERGKVRIEGAGQARDKRKIGCELNGKYRRCSVSVFFSSA